MIQSELLDIKYKTQILLNEKAEYDLEKYFETVHQIVLDTEKNYKLKFHKADATKKLDKEEDQPA
ncbi:MAG: hypothetical protein KJ666_05925 [Bacteroidetes bacterium]|nr:hypothetical protein [Bacteroidota bacterium]MBU2586329.1 hypothetical protein [Bacteroidota bacterium]